MTDGFNWMEVTLDENKFFFIKKEVRNATEAQIALMRGSPYVLRTLQMQFKRMNICRVLRRWNQFI